MKKSFTLFLSLLLLGVANGQMRYFYSQMSGANEIPANGSTGSGVLVAKFNTTTKFLEVYGNYSGLTTSASAAHIHTGAAGASGGVLFGVGHTGGVDGILTGSATLDATAEANLLATSLYVNVHSGTFPGGEIRAQLNPIADGDGIFLNARLQGAQEVPSNGSTATGSAHVVFEKSTRKVYLTGHFTGLISAASNAHIHKSRAGLSGGVIIGLSFSSATAGTLHGSGTVTVDQADSIINNRAYVNVHSSTFPAGEIRGQLTNYSQIRFFGGSLSGSKEVPPNGSTATGNIIARYNPENNEIELTGTYHGLSGSVTGSHIHTGSTGNNGPVLVHLSNTGGSSGSLYVKTSLSDPAEVDLLAGNLYVNVHSSTFPGGEIRSQLEPATAGETQYAEVVLSGLNEVPINASTGIGAALTLLDISTGQAYISGAYSGLGSAAMAAHLHRGVAGTNGPVIMGLTVSGGTNGVFFGSQVLTPAQVDSFINGFTYINIHTSGFPGGEIRGQAANQVLPVRWGPVNGYRQKNTVVISWKVLSEENLMEYELEQQNTLSGQWVQRATIPAFQASPSSYSARDNPLSFGHTYVNYRIKAVDKDGSYHLSKVLQIVMADDDGPVTLLANPVTTSLRLRVAENLFPRGAQAIIVDMQGRVNSQTPLSAGGFHRIFTGSLSPGFYVLQVSDGKTTITRKFVKH